MLFIDPPFVEFILFTFRSFRPFSSFSNIYFSLSQTFFVFTLLLYIGFVFSFFFFHYFENYTFAQSR